MDAVAKVIELVDENKQQLGDGVYLELMNQLKLVHEHIKGTREICELIDNVSPCGEDCDHTRVSKLQDLISEYNNIPKFTRTIAEMACALYV